MSETARRLAVVTGASSGIGAALVWALAFVLSFTEGLDEELRGSGVRALAFCPGPVATEFGEVAGVGARFHEVPGTLSAEEAAGAALEQVEDREVVRVPGPWNKVATTLAQVLPRALVRRAASQVLRPVERA